MDLQIVFDLDGTLITCQNKQKFVLFSILNSIDNNGISQKELDSWWELKRNGLTTEHSLSAMGFCNAKIIADEWKYMIEHFAYCSLDHPFKDSLPSLKFLKISFKTRIIILTSRKCRFHVTQAISNYGFDQYIDDLVVVKPDGGLSGKMDFLNKIRPSLFIGDSEMDYMAAVNSNVNFIALTRGQRSGEFLQKTGAGQIEDDLSFINESFLYQLNN